MIDATKQLPLCQARPIRLAKLSIHIPWRSLAVQLLLVAAHAWPLVFGQAGSPGENKSIIHFKNGDWLRGSLAAYDQGTGVTWRHSDAAVPMRFNTRQLTGITLDGTAVGQLTAGNLCEVELVNGDHFRGNLVGVTGDEFLALTAATRG